MQKSINAIAAAVLLAIAVPAAAQNPDAEAAALADAIRAAGGTPAVAAQAPVQAVPRVALTPEEAEFVREEERLLRQLRLASLRADIAAAQGRATPGAAAAVAGDSHAPVVVSRVAAESSAPAPQRAATPVTQRMNADLPFVLASVWGYENNLTGEVRSHGLNVSVRKGDSLPGGWTVDTIARTGMLIRKGTATRTVMVGD